jgi:heme/copper-type cytochrome/quinol oxidase subunit 3
MSTKPPEFLLGHLRPARIRREDETLRTGQGERGLDLGKGVAPFDEQEVNSFGMAIFLASLAMIFGATLAAYGIFRWREGSSWSAAEPFRNVLTLGLATAVLVACDVLATVARRRWSERPLARKLTLIALGLAFVYLVVQVWNWVGLVGAAVPGDGPRISMEATLFLVLTFTHAVHVLGGVVANTVVVVRSSGGRGPRRASLELLFRYWRFLTIVWFVLVAVLLAT